MRRKGKVHPSPASSAASSSSSSSSSATINKDAQSVLKLLPTAILTIVSILSLNDREVLAYMISRSIKSTNPSNPSAAYHHLQHDSINKPPIFDCECFDCYTSYWYRWDSSPNRELIHQAIEGFEDHLFKRELPPRKGKINKKKEKFEKLQEIEAMPPPETLSRSEPAADLVTECGEDVELLAGKVLFDEGVEMESLPEKNIGVLQGGGGGGGGGGGNNHKGLARKVLPDVLGLFNSRLWNLWGPNV